MSSCSVSFIQPRHCTPDCLHNFNENNPVECTTPLHFSPITSCIPPEPNDPTSDRSEHLQCGPAASVYLYYIHTYHETRSLTLALALSVTTGYRSVPTASAPPGHNAAAAAGRAHGHPGHASPAAGPSSGPVGRAHHPQHHPELYAGAYGGAGRSSAYEMRQQHK